MEQLHRVGELMVGATPGSARRGGSTAKYIRAGDIRDDGPALKPTDGAEPTRGRDAMLMTGDVVVRGRGAPLAASVPANVAGAYPTNDVLLFRPNPAKADTGFITAFLNLPQVRETLSASSQGSALSRLSVQTLGAVTVPLPSLDEQRRIAALADCMRDERHILEKLQELRLRLNQELLHRVMKKTHDEGGNPRRGHSSGQSTSRTAGPNPHLESKE